MILEVKSVLLMPRAKWMLGGSLMIEKSRASEVNRLGIASSRSGLRRCALPLKVLPLWAKVVR